MFEARDGADWTVFIPTPFISRRMGHPKFWRHDKMQVPFDFAQGRLFDCAPVGRFAQDDKERG
jgi:hypothetical protein